MLCLIFAALQSDSVIPTHILFHILFHMVYPRILNTVPCAVQWDPVVYPSHA